MSVIVIAVLFSAGWGFKYLALSPDARYNKDYRTTVFRGDLKNADKF